MKKLIAALGLVALTTVPAAASDDAKFPQVMTLSGTCLKLILGKRDATGQCKGVIVNAAYASGASSFMFVVADTAIVSFYGKDNKAVGDNAVINVDHVTVTAVGDPKAKPVTVSAEGQCTYTNPYAGPSHVDCSARAVGMDFTASFVSDGKPPAAMDAPAS